MLFDIVKHTGVVVGHDGELHHHDFFRAGDVGHQLFFNLEIVLFKACGFGRFFL